MVEATKTQTTVTAVALAGIALAMVLMWRRVAASKELSGQDNSNEEGYCIELLESEPVMGQEKYLGGVLGSDGKVYGIPGNAKRVLRIDPDSSEVSYIGPSFGGKYKWLRGVLAKDG